MSQPEALTTAAREDEEILSRLEDLREARDEVAKVEWKEATATILEKRIDQLETAFKSIYTEEMVREKITEKESKKEEMTEVYQVPFKIETRAEIYELKWLLGEEPDTTAISVTNGVEENYLTVHGPDELPEQPT